MPTSTSPSTTSRPTASRSLVHVPSRDDQRYDHLLRGIEQRTGRLADLEAEIAPLLRALEQFEWQYNSTLGGVQRNLRQVRQQRDTIETWTTRIHARMVADPNHVMGDLFSEEELRQIGSLFGVELPESWFESAREAEERRRREKREEGFFDGNTAAEEEILRRMMRGSRADRERLPDEVEQEIRSLHRSLARRFHPDLATTEAERQLCQEMMLRINDAWHNRDLADLRTLDEQSSHLAGTSTDRGVRRRLHWAEQEVIRLDGLIDGLATKLAALRGSSTFPLWFNPTLARTVITQRASVLQMDLSTETKHLEETKEAFRHALASYAVTVA
ncbi:MAG: J domain-containing protein [Thermomicrobiales bacterium]